jgi:hypothetical protein
MLFRAYVYSAFPTPLSELAVFFEAPTSRDAPQRLQQMLGWMWDCHPDNVHFYNLFNETALRHPDLTQGRCFERGTDADTVLFENGFGPEGATYTPAHRTLLLVSPRWLHRLWSALKLAEQRRTEKEVNAVLYAAALAMPLGQAVAA